jgi:hypothetical protein
MLGKLRRITLGRVKKIIKNFYIDLWIGIYKSNKSLSRRSILAQKSILNEKHPAEKERIYRKVCQLLEGNPADEKIWLIKYFLEVDSCSFEFIKSAKKYSEIKNKNAINVGYEIVPYSIYMGSLGNHLILYSLIQEMDVGYRPKKN